MTLTLNNITDIFYLQIIKEETELIYNKIITTHYYKATHKNNNSIKYFKYMYKNNDMNDYYLKEITN